MFTKLDELSKTFFPTLIMWAPFTLLAIFSSPNDIRTILQSKNLRRKLPYELATKGWLKDGTFMSYGEYFDIFVFVDVWQYEIWRRCYLNFKFIKLLFKRIIIAKNFR